VTTWLKSPNSFHRAATPTPPPTFFANSWPNRASNPEALPRVCQRGGRMRLCGSLGVALGWLSVPESMPSLCLLYGFVMALSGRSTQLCLFYALPVPTVSCR
jgi:hypothetical protein